ncbi:MAG: DUF3341 domain-containing protein [Puniceicoccaceae bacterium]
MSENSLGLIATFRTAPDIYYACQQTNQAGYRKFDAFTPFPVHGLEKAMGLKRSRVPAFTLVGGFTGFFTGLILVAYMNYDYKLVVGGKPLFSPIFPFPIFYELTILLAAFGTLFGMFLLNLLPKHNHPLFDYPDFAKVTDDAFMLMIESRDPLFEEAKVREFLASIGGESITEITKTPSES